LYGFVLTLACGQPDGAGQRDHGAVVGAERGPRKVRPETVFRRCRGPRSAPTTAP
jgi:hypothetical protein